MYLSYTPILLLLIIHGISCKILILGSSGLIGTALTNQLIHQTNNHAYGHIPNDMGTHHKLIRYNDEDVLHVYNRTHIDLRVPNSLDVFHSYIDNITMVYFLACEVGGSKFITDSNNNNIIIENNVLIYNNVFTWLKQHNLPYIFTSSYLQSQYTAYGTIKRLGELYVNNDRNGRIVRLYNIYGNEQYSTLKSHVVTDWINTCITTQSVQSLTNGNEIRQFIHVNDIVYALHIMSHNNIFHQLPKVTELGSGQWISMKYIAQTIQTIHLHQYQSDHHVVNGNDIIQNKLCDYTFSDTIAVVNERIEPDMSTLIYSYWLPNITLADGIQSMYQYYLKLYIDKQQRSSVTTAVIN